MINCPIPRPHTFEPAEGYLCVSPRVSSTEESFRCAVAAFSGLCDRLWGLELNPSDEAVPDEKYFTPLTEAGEFEAPGFGTDEKSSAVALPGEERTDLGIFIVRDGSLEPGECRIEVASACRITARDVEGLWRAFSVIAQISDRTCDKYIKIPKCTVADKPDSPFRGFLLDAARRWHPIDYLYRHVDLCSMAGVNRFIIHFTDDESYTLPSKAFPRLSTESRHYSEEELRALDLYARDRGVMIIPEIDMPGHYSQFATKYPEIFGTCGIMDASEEVFSALSLLYKEVSELFPYSDYVHAGGDEAILGRWNDSKKTIAYMRENGIPDVVGLYGHFVGRVCDGILSLGKTPIVWEGFGESANGLVSKDVLVISWENMYQTADKLVSAGFRILNASWRPLYCVSPWQKWSQEEILSWNKYVWDHWLDKSAAYERGVSVPIDSPVDGGIFCAWGDYMKNYESSRLACQLEYASVFPRLPALSQRLWDSSDIKYDDFAKSFRRFKEVMTQIHGENAFRGEL